MRGIASGAIVISRDGNSVYLGGFGHSYNQTSLVENTPFQLTSVSKPISAAPSTTRVPGS